MCGQKLLYHSHYSFCNFIFYALRLPYISDAKIGQPFYFTINVEYFITDYSLYLLNCRRTNKRGQTYPIFGFLVKNITLFGLN